MRLSTAKIQNVTAQKKTIRLFDGRGLYLEIAPIGSRWWRFKYRFAGKEKRISLGVYPDIGLKTERNSIRAAYNYAEHLPERRRMMHAWLDYLHTLKRRPDAGVQEAA